MDKNEWFITIVIVLGAVFLMASWIMPNNLALNGFDDAAYQADLQDEMR